MLFLLFFAALGQLQDKNLYGEFMVYNYPMDARAIDSINSQCFEGMGYINCKPVNLSTRESRDNSIPYYVQLLDIVDDYICLQCCGINQNVDIWDLECPITMLTALTYNNYGLVLHMAKRRFGGDREIVSCPMKRSICNYDEITGETIDCDGYLNDETYLIGYVLTLNVIQYSEYFSYWKGITSCSIEALESSSPLVENDVFKEKIVLVHLPVSPTFDYFRISVLFILLIFVLYPIMYYCRDANCSVCSRKLIFFFNRCPMCRFVEAHPADPRLVSALEEKSKYLQGQMQLEAYPGKSKLEFIFGRIFNYFCPGCYVYLFGGHGARVAVLNNNNDNNNDNDDDDDDGGKLSSAEVSGDFEESERKRQVWLDDIYNFTDPDPPALRGGKSKIPEKVLKIRAAQKPYIEPEIISSTVDREKLDEHFPDDYVVYRAIEHPFLPSQILGRGKQGFEWREKKSKN